MLIMTKLKCENLWKLTTGNKVKLTGEEKIPNTLLPGEFNVVLQIIKVAILIIYIACEHWITKFSA